MNLRSIFQIISQPQFVQGFLTVDEPRSVGVTEAATPAVSIILPDKFDTSYINSAYSVPGIQV